MTSPNLLGLDIGTSGAKAAVIDSTGALLGWAATEYPILTPRPGWAEQDPAEWLKAASACAREAIAQAGIDPGSVAGIGLAGQMHSLVCVGSDGKPVRPAILWADQRSAAQVKQITERVGKANLAKWTGNPLAAGFMAASWEWLREFEPQTIAATRWLMLPKDYARYQMTGAVGTEPSDASSTGLFDPHHRRWSAEMMNAVGLSGIPVGAAAEPLLPEIHDSSGVAGGLLPEAAQAFGLPSGVPVVFGGSDVSLQALAQGIVSPGTVSCTIGTGGQLFAPLDAPRHDPELRLHLFCHALPDTWHQEAAILTAGLALRWLRDQVWPGSSYNALASQAAQVEAALDGLFFLPFLAGERTPYMDPALRGAFLGLALRHGQTHLVRAVMEGVIFALRQGLDLMESLGTPIEQLVATGGATRHPLWLQLQADIFNRPIYTASSEPGGPDLGVSATARGAALLAGIGTSVYADAAEAIRATTRPPVEAAAPNPLRARLYAAAYYEYTQWAEFIVDHDRTKERS